MQQLHIENNKMSRRPGPEMARILVNHWRWLEARGYKRQATSCKRQAASLTRQHYNDIQEVKGERYVKERSKKNNRWTVEAI